MFSTLTEADLREAARLGEQCGTAAVSQRLYGRGPDTYSQRDYLRRMKNCYAAADQARLQAAFDDAYKAARDAAAPMLAATSRRI
jgi:hypothetical protein